MDRRALADGFSVSPQIAPGDLAALAGAGVRLVINNRPDGEEPGQPDGAEIAAAAEAAGIAYVAIPVGGGGFGQPQVAALDAALAGAAGPVHAYCRSGTRSTLLWALVQASRGTDPATIAETAAAAGYDVAPVRAALDLLAAGGAPR